MTSQILSSLSSHSKLVNLNSSPEQRIAGQDSETCPFCRIINGTSNAFKVFETEHIIAVLDILPLRPGHTLIIPKSHYKNVSDLPEELAGAVGVAVSKVARALTQALGNNGLNVVCNQEYAQAVPHVHYHIIPAPTFEAATSVSAMPSKSGAGAGALTPEEMLRREFAARSILDEKEARRLVEAISAKL